MDKSAKKEIYAAICLEIESAHAPKESGRSWKHDRNCDSEWYQFAPCSCGHEAQTARLTAILQRLHIALAIGTKKRKGTKWDDHHK